MTFEEAVDATRPVGKMDTLADQRDFISSMCPVSADEILAHKSIMISFAAIALGCFLVGASENPADPILKALVAAFQAGIAVGVKMERNPLE